MKIRNNEFSTQKADYLCSHLVLKQKSSIVQFQKEHCFSTLEIHVALFQNQYRAGFYLLKMLLQQEELKNQRIYIEKGLSQVIQSQSTQLFNQDSIFLFELYFKIKSQLPKHFFNTKEQRDQRWHNKWQYIRDKTHKTKLIQSYIYKSC